MSLLLKINGLPFSFRELGVTGGSLELSNQGLDRLVLTLARDLRDAALFPPFARVVLLDEGGVSRFIGWVDQEPILVSPERQEWQVIISGPWRWLDLTNYSQQFVLPNGDLSPGIQVAVLNQGRDSSGNVVKLSISGMISAALRQVVDLYGQVIDFATEEVAALPYELPWSEKQNTTCGSVIRDQLAWVPGHSAWWDYSGNVPVLRLTATPTEATHQVAETGVDATSLSLNPRFDLLVRKVQINYVWSYLSNDSVTVFRTVTSEVATAAEQSDAAVLVAPGEMRMSFSLQQGETPPEPGIAGAFLAAVEKLSIQTEFVVLDESMGWQYSVGDLWGFSGMASRWNAYTSVLQVCTRDLFTKEIRLRLGPATHLGLQQFFALNRKNPPHSTAGGGGAGQGPQPKSSPPGSSQQPQDPGTIMVSLGSVEGGIGDLSDLLEAQNGSTILAHGPGGITRQATPSNGSATISQCPPGNYTLEVIPALGWKYADDFPENNRFVTVLPKGLAHGALFITRVKFSSQGFEVVKSPAKKDQAQKLGIYYNSSLFLGVGQHSPIPVTGLLTSLNPSTSDAGWISALNNLKIWLEVHFTNGVPSSATIQSGVGTAGFDDSLDAWTERSIVEKDSESQKQTVARKLIAEATLEGSSLFVEQHFTGNLHLMAFNIDGYAAYYPAAL